MIKADIPVKARHMVKAFRRLPGPAATDRVRANRSNPSRGGRNPTQIPFFRKTSDIMRLIFKIVPETLWQEAERDGVFKGAPVDLADGYIHFSTAEQARETAAKHFVGQDGLLLAAFDAEIYGADLKWEPSRGGDLFPHLYAELDPKSALWVRPLPLGNDGIHVFPDLAQ